MASFTNYGSVNKTDNPSSKQWCLSAKVQKTLQQATVSFGTGGKYPYASRYPVTEGDVAIIGNTLPWIVACEVKESATTGKMGIASEVLPKVEIRRDKATELDMVFTAVVQKKHITACIKYLDLPQDETTLQYDKQVDKVYPITFLIRKVLAAASIISFPKFAGADAVQKAKDYLCREQALTKECLELGKAWPEPVDICLGDVHVKDAQRCKKELTALKEQGLQGLSAVTLIGEKRAWDVDPAINGYVNKWVYIGAVSVMARGGFLNLLNAFLSADPPVMAFYDDLLESIGKCGNPETLSVLESYKPVR